MFVIKLGPSGEVFVKLPFVDRYEGRGPTLYASINPLAVDEDGLREMLALFRRYGIGLRQLAVFDRDEFSEWFRDKRAYWHKDVFGWVALKLPSVRRPLLAGVVTSDGAIA